MSSLTDDGTDCKYCSLGCNECREFSTFGNNYFSASIAASNTFDIYARQCYSCATNPADSEITFYLEPRSGRCIPCPKDINGPCRN